MNNTITDSSSIQTYEGWSDETTGIETSVWYLEVTDSSEPAVTEEIAEEKITNFSEDLDDAGLNDMSLAHGLAHIASKATKAIHVWDWDIVDVPDYPTRLSAIKLALSAKWHLAEKKQWADKAKKHIKYILK